MADGKPGRPRRMDLDPERREFLDKKNERRRRRRLDPDYKAKENARAVAQRARRKVEKQNGKAK